MGVCYADYRIFYLLRLFFGNFFFEKDLVIFFSGENKLNCSVLCIVGHCDEDLLVQNSTMYVRATIHRFLQRIGIGVV